MGDVSTFHAGIEPLVSALRVEPPLPQRQMQFDAQHGDWSAVLKNRDDDREPKLIQGHCAACDQPAAAIGDNWWHTDLPCEDWANQAFVESLSE